MERHNCGGNLYPKRMIARREVHSLAYRFTIPGLECDLCHEELVSRDVARTVEQRVAYLEQVENTTTQESLSITLFPSGDSGRGRYQQPTAGTPGPAYAYA